MRKISKRRNLFDLWSDKKISKQMERELKRRKFGVFSRSRRFLCKSDRQRFLPSPWVRRGNRLDLRRWPTFPKSSPSGGGEGGGAGGRDGENSSGRTNSRKGIDLFISSCWTRESSFSSPCSLSLSLSPSIKTFKMVETLVVLVERIARCVNGALILTKRRKSCVVTRHYPVQISPSPITW